MVSKQTKTFEVAKDVIDKQLYEHAEQIEHRYSNISPEPIDHINLEGLDYILFLDRQTYDRTMSQINKLYDLIDDLAMHYKEVRDFRDGLLEDMEKSVNRPEFVGEPKLTED